jgi:putative effector of murein hydrolase LrgA (UPF0299 family)
MYDKQLAMNLLSPINSLIFRITVAGIFIAYFLFLIKVLRQIILEKSFSNYKKTIAIMLVLFIPIGGLILYFSFLNSQKEFEVSSK